MENALTVVSGSSAAARRCVNEMGSFLIGAGCFPSLVRNAKFGGARRQKDDRRTKDSRNDENRKKVGIFNQPV